MWEGTPSEQKVNSGNNAGRRRSGVYRKKCSREIRIYRALALKYIDAFKLPVPLLPYFPTV